MKLFEQLRALGTRLKIIQAVEAQGKKPPRRVTTRMVSLDTLRTELQAADVEALAQLPAEISVEFSRLFEASGIKGDCVWTVEYLSGLLSTPQFKGMDRAAAQKALVALMAAEKTDPEILVKDAIARDRALDAYEDFIRRKVADRAAARDRELAAVQAKIARLTDERSRIEEEARLDAKRLRQWLRKKSAYERDMARAVSYLIEGEIVTVDSGEESE
jgi:hypothetical protein